MLDLPILGFLKEEPRHGYELRQRLGELGLRLVSFGSLYPALRRLERRSFIEALDGGSRRKTYTITPQGDRYFLDLLESRTSEQEDDRAFSIRVAFFRYLDPEKRLYLLERRKAVLEDRAAEVRASLHASMARTKERIDRYTLSLIEQGARHTATDIDWIDELIETERATIRRRRSADRWGPTSEPIRSEKG